MAQTGHPYSSQVKASQSRRLRALGAKAGKAWGSSAQEHKKKYAKKNAGQQREFTIPGGKGRRRADRFAGGGSVGGGGGKHRGHTTNIIISHAGGRGGGGGAGAPGVRPGPVLPPPVVRPPIVAAAPIARPPLPVGGPPMGGAMPPAPVGAALPPMRPPMPVGPAGPVPVRPPGMKKGGRVAGQIDVKDSPGKGYRGYPFSPTTDVDDAVSARKRGGRVTFKRGGRIKGLAAGGASDDGSAPAPDTGGSEDGVDKMQFGGMPGGGFSGGPFGGTGNPQAMGGGQAPGGVSGLMGQIPGRTPQRPIQGPPNISGRPMIPAQPVTVPMPATMSSFRAWPAPGTRVGFSKKGGAVHSDEAEDKKLFKRMYKEEEAKEEKGRKRGGAIGELGGSNRPGHTVLGRPGGQFNVGSVPAKSVPKGHASVMSGPKYKNWGKGKRKDGGSAGDSIQKSRPTGLAGDKYHQQGVGYRAAGGTVSPRVGPLEGGSGSAMGRLRNTRKAEKIPDKTEL